MAFGRTSLGSSAASGGRALGGGGQRPLSDINMTPLIDVMLVLLVIFIITAPLMASSLKLDLPKAAGAAGSDAPAFITLAIDAEGRLFVGEKRLDAAQEQAHIAQHLRGAARPGHRSAAARRRAGALRPRRPADRLGAGSRPDAHRLRHRSARRQVICSAAGRPSCRPSMSLDTELAALRQPLLRFALMQLRNAAAAEDVVSETMLAILEKPASFEGRSSLRTYATGVLKFKIIDLLRRQGREVCI